MCIGMFLTILLLTLVMIMLWETIYGTVLHLLLCVVEEGCVSTIFSNFVEEVWIIFSMSITVECKLLNLLSRFRVFTFEEGVVIPPIYSITKEAAVQLDALPKAYRITHCHTFL